MSSKIATALLIAFAFATASTAASAAVSAPWPPPPGAYQAVAPGYAYSAKTAKHKRAQPAPQQGEAHGSR